MAKSYQSDAIEVLEGLEPVRKRPGMYTDTTRPNHLAQEVIDNCVDEALAGHASEIQVTLSKDHSMSISDNGRGMPVDVHKKEKVSGVELILTRLHSGAKFNNDQYRYSGGLHGVGVSVVNAIGTVRGVCSTRRQSAPHVFQRRRDEVPACDKRIRRQTEHGHAHRVQTQSKVFRFPSVFGVEVETLIKSQGCSLPRLKNCVYQRDGQ